MLKARIKCRELIPHWPAIFVSPGATPQTYVNSNPHNSKHLKMGRRRHTGYTGGYAHVQYCTWAHGGVAAAETGSASKSRQEKILVRKRQKKFEQFLREPKINGTDDGLCTFCQSIDFERIFSLNSADISDHGLAVLSLNHLAPDLIAAKCPACAMFASMAYEVEEIEVVGRRSLRVEWHLRAFPASCLWGVRHPAGQAVSVLLCLVREVDTESFRFPRTGPVGVPEELDHALLEDSWRRGFIVPSTATIATRPPHGCVCRGVYLEPDTNYERISQLLDECSNNHLECANYSLGPFPQGAHVIDCATREIVSLVPGMNYLALSYVWGDPSLSQTAQAKSILGQTVYLNQNASQTIEDAITVTQGLGHKFLWIDRYCIQQHNNAEKKKQIQQMASIYSHAIATICATGDDTNAGLYGVSQSRKPQQRLKSQGLTMIRCPWPEYHIREHIKLSRWTTRGWTYQEPLLSKNCLFFTPETMVQVCHTRTFAEALAVEYNLTSCFTNRTVVLSSSLFMVNLPLCMSASLPRSQLAFTQAVQQYQKRRFSYESDALDAFKGFLSTVEMRSYWGVPILRIEQSHMVKTELSSDFDFIAGFAFGLLWITTGRLPQWDAIKHERAWGDFPSWSWVSRRATLTDFLSHTGVLKSAKIRSFQLNYRPDMLLYNAKILVEADDGKLIHPRDLFKTAQGVKLVEEQSKYLVITSVTARWTLTPIHFGDRTTGKLRGAHFPNILLEDVSDTSLQPYLAQMKLAGPARIAFDQGYYTQASADLEKHPEAPSRNGIAVLLLISKWAGKLEGSYTYWLAVQQVSDGSFRRQGMIECHLLEREAFKSGYVPPNASLKSIRLG